jgi:protein SCO1/2
MRHFLLPIFLIICAPAFSAESFGPKSLYRLEQQWTSQNGKTQFLSDLKGKPTIAAMIFTSCPATCPVIVSDMKSLDSRLTKTQRNNVQYALFSIDPARDTPAALLSFSKKMKLDARWTLLTSKPDHVRELSVVLGFNYKPLDDGDFTHSTTVFLLSADGEVVAKKERVSDEKEFMEKVRSLTGRK